MSISEYRNTIFKIEMIKIDVKSEQRNTIFKIEIIKIDVFITEKKKNVKARIEST